MSNCKTPDRKQEEPSDWEVKMRTIDRVESIGNESNDEFEVDDEDDADEVEDDDGDWWSPARKRKKKKKRSMRPSKRKKTKTMMKKIVANLRRTCFQQRWPVTYTRRTGRRRLWSTFSTDKSLWTVRWLSNDEKWQAKDWQAVCCIGRSAWPGGSVTKQKVAAD